MRTFFFWLFLIMFLVGISCGIYDGLDLAFSDSTTTSASWFVGWLFVSIVAFAVLWLMEQARTYPDRVKEERFEQELIQGKHHLR